MVKLKVFLILLSMWLVGASCAGAQAVSTASRVADLQIGVSFSYAASDYTNTVADPGNTNDVYNLKQPTGGSTNWHGFGAYADLAMRYHYGLEFSIRQVSGPQANLSERTYQVGPRLILPLRGRVTVYGKALYGRGIFNFAAVNSAGQSVTIANLGYNVLTGGGGVDLRLKSGWSIRLLDYEYQRWLNFPPNKLTPQVVSVGVAYHFHGGLGGRRF